MVIFDTYSKRQKGLPDVFKYDKISEKLKNQIYHIWNDFLDQDYFDSELKRIVRKHIYETILKEEGKKQLHYNGMFKDDNPVTQVEKYFEDLKDTEKILDVVEITFYFIGKMEALQKDRNIYQYQSNRTISYSTDRAITDLNCRFKENGIGYEFSNNQIIRIDNKLLHNETIQTALNLLSEPDYKNANEEFLKAHEHYRHGRNQECLNECLKAFESTIKIICKKNGWTFNETDTAKPLINILITNSFLPTYNESSLSAMRQLLEGSIPTVRNKNSGHGQGTKKITVADNLANYMLYITGSTIRLLVDIQNDNEKKPSL